MSEVPYGQEHETLAGETRQLSIPDLNVWRWQAESAAVAHLGNDERGFGMAHDVSRFFDNGHTIALVVSIALRQRLAPAPYNLIDVCEGNLEITRGVGIREARNVRIMDLDRFFHQLDEIEIQTGVASYHNSGRRELWSSRDSDKFKTTLKEVLELTYDGLLGTSTELSRGLLHTIQLIEF